MGRMTVIAASKPAPVRPVGTCCGAVTAVRRFDTLPAA